MKKLYLANSLPLFDLWMTIAIPYMVFRGLTLDTVFSLIAIYTIFATVLEYPTGVIGDYFGHKSSVVAGTIFAALSNMLLIFSSNYLWFLTALLVRALGMTLRSGSTEAMLKSSSTTIKQDFAKFSALEDVILFAASVAAGFIAEISFNLALGINLVATCLSVLVIVSVKDTATKRKQKGNIFALANKGMTEVLTNSKLLMPVLLLMFFYGYGRNVKSIFGVMSETFDLRLSYLGIIIGLGMLVRSLGRYLYGRYKHVNINVVVIGFLTLLFVAGITQSIWVIISLLLTSNILMGFLLSWLKVDIIEHSSEHVRASVLSFSGLLSTLSGSVYLFLFGKASVTYSISSALLVTSLFLLGVFGVSKARNLRVF